MNKTKRISSLKKHLKSCLNFQKIPGLTGFSLERMFRFLNAFEIDVEIRVKPKSSHNARITVV